MNKSKIESILFILLLIGAIIFGYYKYIFQEQLETIHKAKKDIAANQVVLTKLQAIMKDKNGTLLAIAKAENKAAVLDKAIPLSSSNYDFNLQLFNTIKAYGLVSKNLQPQTPVKSAGFTSQTINIQVSGKTNNVLNFISFLQNNPRRIQIIEASIRQPSVDEMDANIKINIYSSST